MVRRWGHSRATLALLGAAIAVGASTANACIHVPRDYRDAVTESTKEALLFHDGKNAHLVMNTKLSTKSKLPSSLAWVIPVPSLPSRYSEADPKLFAELFRATEPPAPAPGVAWRGKGAVTAGAAPPAPMKVHDTVRAGRYEVRPIEILDPNAGNDLNRWLGRHGYGKVTFSLQKQYLRKKAVFLAVKVSDLHSGSATLRPLHIVYASDRVTMPLKFAEKSGVFDLLLYTFMPNRPHGGQFGVNYLYGFGSGAELKDGKQTPLLWRLTGRQKGFLTRFTGGQLNAPGRQVKSMLVDPTLLAKPRKLFLMGPPRPLESPAERTVGKLRVGQQVALR